MLSIVDSTTNPFWNLAAEEFILTQMKEPVMRLWQNSDSVIVGRHQNAYAEIDLDYVEKTYTPVVRRMTGGGAVFHDLGNVNYSFFDLKEVPFTEVILDALRDLGVEARTEGRNDLTIEGRKFSGSAACKHGGRLLEHGTLLFRSSMSNLAAALKPRPEKFEGKAVKSTRSRVTNISEHLPRPMLISEFILYLEQAIGSRLGCTPYYYSDQDKEGIRKLYLEKYATREWNLGKSPAYEFTNVKKFPAGLLEAHFNVKDGLISELNIFGDYFSKLPTEDFCQALYGCPHERKKIADRISGLAVGEYFCGISHEELLQLLL